MDERMREELLRQVQEAISAAWNITEESARETLAHYRKQQRQRWHAGEQGQHVRLRRCIASSSLDTLPDPETLNEPTSGALFFATTQD